MTDAARDVVAVGNAIVDVLTHTTDTFITEEGLPKGGMTLIDDDQARALYDKLGPAVEMSGGSAANTVAGLASFGSKAGFIGKVRNDQLGDVFRHDIKAIGVDFPTGALGDGASTARCLILITPDAQRTMATYLGAAQSLSPDDIDPDFIKSAKVTYLEGYLFDPPEAKRAFVRAAEVAHDAGRQVSLSLSDEFCVDRHRADFRELVKGHVDILFANEQEIMSLYETDDFDKAAAAARAECKLACLTRSEKGSLIIGDGITFNIPVMPVEHVVDTTGAGDLYAAGFLHGYTDGRPLYECGQLASLAAAEVISHVGARPEANLRLLADERLDN